jgi:hypothetical protein
LFAVVSIGVVFAACSATSAAPSSKHVTSASPYFLRSGTGDQVLPSRVLPSKWTVNWTFDCNSPTKTGTFVLSTTKDGGSAVDVTNQTGLGGSGHKPFTKSGNYGFAVKTSCGWKVAVGTTPANPPKAKPTATTAPVTSSPPTT